MPQPAPTLNYAVNQRAPATGSAVTSFCLGLLVSVEAIWALTVMSRLNRHGDTESWSVLGFLLLVGVLAAVIGLSCALYGRLIKAPANRLRLIGGLMNAAYLVGYGLLIAVVLIAG